MIHETIITSSNQISKQPFKSVDVLVTGVGHVLAAFVDNEDDFTTSPVSDVASEGNEATDFWHSGRAWLWYKRAISFGEDEASDTGGRGRMK